MVRDIDFVCRNSQRNQYLMFHVAAAADPSSFTKGPRTKKDAPWQQQIVERIYK